MFKLTDKQQAIIMFIVAILPSVIVWLSSPNGLFDEWSLRFLFASICSGIIVFFKEIAAYKPRET